MKKYKHKHPKHEHPKKAHRPTAKVLRAKEPEKQFRWIENLRNIHEGKEIWVLGCGPSLDDFPDNFFDDRIAIAVKWSLLAFPNCAYNFFSWSCGQMRGYVLHNRSNLWNRYIIALRPKKHPVQSEPIYMHVLGKRVYEDYYKTISKSIMAGKPPYRYGATNTLLHWALQAAIIMGAKKVTAVGCEAKWRKFQVHALKRGMDQIYGKRELGIPPGGWPLIFQEGKTPGQQEMRAGTDWIAKYFRPYGVEVSRYFYGKGYEKII